MLAGAEPKTCCKASADMTLTSFDDVAGLMTEPFLFFLETTCITETKNDIITM